MIHILLLLLLLLFTILCCCCFLVLFRFECDYNLQSKDQLFSDILQKRLQSADQQAAVSLDCECECGSQSDLPAMESQEEENMEKEEDSDKMTEGKWRSYTRTATN